MSMKRIAIVGVILVIGVAVGALAKATSARPPQSLVYSGYGTVESWHTSGNLGPDYTGRMCWGEDGSNKTQLTGIMQPGEIAVVLPYVCQELYQDGTCCIPGSGGGIGFRVFAQANGQGTGQLVARVVKPTGEIVTHNDNLVCFAPQVWYDRGNPQPVGEGGLDGGTYRLEVENIGTKAVRGTVVLIDMFMSYIFESTCPEDDVNWIGH